MSDLDEFKATYFEECAELLLELEEQFAAIDGGERSPERLNAIFRAIHSIKGGGGAFGFTALVGFTHAYETLLDRIRDGRLAMTPSVIALCLRSNDVVQDLVTAARTGAATDPRIGDTERIQFDRLTSSEIRPAAPIAAARVPVEEVDSFDEPPLVGETGNWEISFRPHPELYARANDPLLLLRELGTLGDIRVKAVLDEMPPLAEFEPFGVYCGWEIALSTTAATHASIAEVFEFVDGNCDLSIVQLRDAVVPLPPRPVVAPTHKSDVFTPSPVPPPPVDMSDDTAVAAAPVVDADRRVGEADRRAGLQSIRVDLEKVDRVVNMVGELVITQSMLTQQIDETLRARYQEIVRGLEVLAQTTRGLQDAVMAIRAQPVKSVFSRMPRLVRELMQQTGKAMRLEMVGEQTEIDKTVIEQLSEPLTHMIRNAADHGIEMPEARRAAGKPEAGIIRIAAEQAGGNILVTVEDDGAGINRRRVLEVARQRMIVGPDQTLSDEQIDQLIFAPGFTTVENVTAISGRGVGMDVVLANVKRIGGSVSVRSRPGKGTRMTLRLPLTLAVLDVMLVRVGGNPYVVPLSSIVETIQCARAEFGTTPSGARLLRVRGEYVPVIDVADHFGIATPGDGKFVVLCEADGTSRVGLVVDDVMGQQQVVIKSLEANFERIEGIAGGTILGDGNVALIIDPQGMRTSIGQRRAA